MEDGMKMGSYCMFHTLFVHHCMSNNNSAKSFNFEDIPFGCCFNAMAVFSRHNFILCIIFKMWCKIREAPLSPRNLHSLSFFLVLHWMQSALHLIFTSNLLLYKCSYAIRNKHCELLQLVMHCELLAKTCLVAS